MPSKVERRFLPIDTAELRADGEGRKLAGYAAVFNVEAIIWDSWREMVAPGAYAKTLAEHDIRGLWNHDQNIVLGRNKANTLRLREDSYGLNIELDPPDNEWGRPVLDAVRRGDVTGMSLSFRAIKQEWVSAPEGSRELPLRIVREAKLFEISPVTFPAFEQTTVGVRSESLEDIERGEDVIDQARALVRCAERGYMLTDEDRSLIAVARDLLAAAIPTLEPEVNAHHSSSEPEVLRTHHSAAWRARELQLLGLALH